MKLTQVPASDLGCKPNRPKSVFWSELLGTRRYTPNSFFLSSTKVVSLLKILF